MDIIYNPKTVLLGKRIKYLCSVDIEDFCLIGDFVTFGNYSGTDWDIVHKGLKNKNPNFKKLLNKINKDKKISIKTGTIIHDNIVIGANTIIGKNCVIEPFIYIGSDCTIEENALIKSHTSIGDGNFIGKNAIMGEGCRIGNTNSIGENTTLLRNTVISHDVTIGKNCRINGYISNKCNLGDNVSMLGSLIHVYKTPKVRIKEPSCVLEDNVTVGMEAAIIGVRLGSGCYVGAGAVVTHDVPPKKVVIGVPAKELIKNKGDTN